MRHGTTGTRKGANQAFDHFLEKYRAKHDAACDCLAKDRDVFAMPQVDDRTASLTLCVTDLATVARRRG